MQLTRQGPLNGRERGESIKQNRMASHLNLAFLVVAVVVTLDYN